MNIETLKKETLQGYNTYFNNSVLTHVLMPQGFAVSLGFKFYNTNKVLKEALIGRFGEDDEKIHPGPRSFDGTYTELRLTDSGHEIKVQSASADGKLYLLITPMKNVKRPPALLISAAVLWNKEGYTERRGDTLKATLPGKTITVYTDGTQERQMNTGLTNPWLAVTLDRPVAVSTDSPVCAGEAAGIMKKHKAKVLSECAQYGKISEAYNAMRTCLAWNTIYEPEKDRLCSPVSRLWNINWGGYALFEWDMYFSAMMAMVENKNLAYSNAIAITREITERGFVPNFSAADDSKSRDRSQPPVGSMAVMAIYKKYNEKWLIEYLFDDLLRWNRWFSENRCLENGQLCWGSDPYQGTKGSHWETEGVHGRFGAALESGLDNSPMYDDVPFNKETNLMELADVGLTGLYINDCETLAELAGIIGRSEAQELKERAHLSKLGLEGMWDESFGMYLNKRTDTGELSYRISPTNFYALFSDMVPPERARRMIDEHYFNENEFYGEFVIPAIARNDPAYKDQDYWRGRIWSPLNFLVYLAIRNASLRTRQHNLTGTQRSLTGAQSALKRALKDLAEKSLNLLLKEWQLHGHVHENYNGDDGIGCDVKSSDKFYHWGALLTMIALMEEGKHGPDLSITCGPCMITEMEG